VGGGGKGAGGSEAFKKEAQSRALTAQKKKESQGSRLAPERERRNEDHASHSACTKKKRRGKEGRRPDPKGDGFLQRGGDARA